MCVKQLNCGGYEMNDELVKKPENSGQNITQTGTGFKVGIPKFQQKVNQAKAAQAASDPSTMKHRIGLMLDCSGSMNELEGFPKTKIAYLREAGESFVQFCNFSETSVAIETFPKKVNRPLNSMQGALLVEVSSLTADGGTPMGEAMQAMLEINPINRGVLISDGHPTDYNWEEQARNFASAEIQIDCVHIGKTDRGKDTLQKIAEITGGMYFKFEDIENFTKSFKFLAPAFRAMLAASNEEEAKKMLGASEAKL